MIQKNAIALFTALLLSTGVVFADPLRIDEKQIRANGSAEVEFQSGAVRLRFDDPERNSGVRLLPPEGVPFWDFSGAKVLSVDVENLSTDKQLRLTMHLASGRDERTVGLALNPGEKRTLTMHLPHRTIYEFPKGTPGVRILDTQQINWIEFNLQWPFEGKADHLVDCRITNLRLADRPDTAAHLDEEHLYPFIDIYGQYLHADWPEKIHTDSDLQKVRDAELSELANSKRPEEWDRFGGWKNGPQLEATGNFRTEKHDGKWYLVDPEGRLFFSHGLDVLLAHPGATKSTSHEKWFAFKVEGVDLPFNDWNLQKKYGQEDYDADYYTTLSKRLDHWGFNTIGAWGNRGLIELGHRPYTLQLTEFGWNRIGRIAGSKLKFYDVFDPEYINAMKNLIADAGAKNPAVTKSLTDPMCIGYFIDNELNFGNRSARVSQTYGDDVLQSPARQPAKQEFIADLKAKYDTIEKLNEAWGTRHASWEALLNHTKLPKSKRYMADSDLFFDKAVDQYFRLCRDAIKSVAPHRLYLGCRFISTDAARKTLAAASKKYCDILTVNIYAHSAAGFGVGKEFPDMPVLIGEFHFGILDRGMLSPGLAAVGTTQKERALAYTRFLQGALVHPKIVGAHWFQYWDQPLTGRSGDGERYAIGFVDVADTPYPEMTRAAREVGEKMYQYRERGTLLEFMK